MGHCSCYLQRCPASWCAELNYRPKANGTSFQSFQTECHQFSSAEYLHAWRLYYRSIIMQYFVQERAHPEIGGFSYGSKRSACPSICENDSAAVSSVALWRTESLLECWPPIQNTSPIPVVAGPGTDRLPSPAPLRYVHSLCQITSCSVCISHPFIIQPSYSDRVMGVQSCTSRR